MYTIARNDETQNQMSTMKSTK